MFNNEPSQKTIFTQKKIFHTCKVAMVKNEINLKVQIYFEDLINVL